MRRLHGSHHTRRRILSDRRPSRAEGALLSAWNSYVTQVHAYLRLVEGTWELG